MRPIVFGGGGDRVDCARLGKGGSSLAKTYLQRKLKEEDWLDERRSAGVGFGTMT